MPDFAMCKHPTCPVRATCRRSAASGTEPSTPRQTFAGFAPDPVTGECDKYVMVGDGPPRNRAGENLYLIGASTPLSNGFR